MASVYDLAIKFKREHPTTVGWRIPLHSRIVEMHLNPGETVEYVFVAQKNDNPLNIFETAVIGLTNERIVIGRKRLLFGYFFTSITPDLFNDLKIVSGIVWSKVYIDTVKEFVALSNISKDALIEIESKISSFMIEKKKEYGIREGK
jgi:hypothetical protein